MGWQTFWDGIFGSSLTMLVLLLTFGRTSVLCSWFCLLVDVGEGRGSRFEEATLIMDIAGCGGAQLETQFGVERVRIPEGVALKG